MKKGLLVLLTLLMAASLFAAGQAETGGRQRLELLQNKPEIDAELKAYAQQWGRENNVDVVIKTVGGSIDVTVEQMLTIGYSSGEMPDIFVFPGLESYQMWSEVILDLSDEPWVQDTSVEFTYDGRVYGFPVNIEGWGLAYNADILEAAGIDPAGLTNLDAYREAFATLDSMKDELGIKAPVSMAAAMSMGWVTAHHNFNSLLSNGLPYGDLSVVNDLRAGNVDMDRLGQYADWVELLFTYADQAVLTTGDYDAQVGAFVAGDTAFLHQGNWVDGNIADAGADFPIAFAPHGSLERDTDGIFVAAPAYYAINAESRVTDIARKFLNDMVYTEAGQRFMVEEAGMIPAFSNVESRPSGPLSQSVQEWNAADQVYSWNQYYFSDDFRDNTLAPIYNRFASGAISKEQFVNALRSAFESLQ
ncbi:ABC transporter substrate-binding protein [Spirochaeta africana]|uniref:ABC-type sugar transport system, periplasmic component n=1 Tax=Spirochaeta africana (strain ATCC 700263 / DSM 8902 / Z-7692) TaxID=889378 RepID=H9UL95_SPIAZ|nr:extracellular solute-binding protein [Spirochaeta africana]AFG38288.1 ABC-type sugar transport system, periplasmic component [Spirochaeta africana DSM 8902]